MADLMQNDAFVSINGTDLSNNVRSVSLNYSREALDNTKMGNTTRSRTGGLFDWTLDVEFISDEAASQVSATLFSLIGTAVTIIYRAVNTGGVSATNPNYTGSAYLESLVPIGGEVGQLSMSPLVCLAAGALSRATS